MEHSIALVTGTTSGLGYAAARILPERAGARSSSPGAAWLGSRKRPLSSRLRPRHRSSRRWSWIWTRRPAFSPPSPSSSSEVGRSISCCSMQGWSQVKKRVLTAAGVEASQAPLIGHHQLTVGLLRANLLSPNARIVIAGAEPARGGVPMFSYTDVPAFAAKYHQGDRTAAVEALLRNGPNVKYVPNNAYADAKLIIAWWVAALARRLPSGMAVYAVSPGAATDTKVVRNAGPALKYLFIPIVNLIPGMNQTPETAARRYLQASEFGTDVSGQFFASAQGKFTGPIEAQRHPHLHDRASQEAAWQAVVKVSGVDLSSPASLSAVS